MCAVLSGVCATTVDNNGVYVYYLKGIVSVCFRFPARTVCGFLWNTALLVHTTTNQAERRSSAAHLLARWEHERTTAWWSRAQGGGPSVRFLQPASITSSGAFKPECNGMSQFREDTGGRSLPVREFNLIACPLVQSS